MSHSEFIFLIKKVFIELTTHSYLGRYQFAALHLWHSYSNGTPYLSKITSSFPVSTNLGEFEWECFPLPKKVVRGQKANSYKMKKSLFVPSWLAPPSLSHSYELIVNRLICVCVCLCSPSLPPFEINNNDDTTRLAKTSKS